MSAVSCARTEGRAFRIFRLLSSLLSKNAKVPCLPSILEKESVLYGSIKPVMLAHGIGDTFCLYLAGAAVGSVLQVLQRGVKVNVMELRMGDFMDKGF